MITLKLNSSRNVLFVQFFPLLFDVNSRMKPRKLQTHFLIVMLCATNCLAECVLFFIDINKFVSNERLGSKITAN